MSGYRNVILGVLYLGCCCLLGYWAGEAALPQMGGTFGSLGLGVTGVVAGRAFNKFAEAKANGGAK